MVLPPFLSPLAPAHDVTIYRAPPGLTHTTATLPTPQSVAYRAKRAQSYVMPEDAYGVKRRDTSKGPPLRVLCLGWSLRFIVLDTSQS